MKKNILILFVLLSAIGYSQNGINYKALIKDASGNVVANTTIQIQFTIVEDITNVYTETHAPTTDANGIVIVNIGEGAAISGDFNSINWAVRTHFLNVQIDAGNGLVDLGTTQFMSVPYAKYAETAANASNVNGLEAIDEGNGIGWRLVGANPAYYGDIGLNAVDLSFNAANSTTHGAIGNNSTALGIATVALGASSFAVGDNAAASGNSSVAMGFGTVAFGDYSTAMGSITRASGANSTAMGNQTLATGDNSTAMGNASQASGEYAIAMGHEATASGSESTAMGFQTIASGQRSTAIGYTTQALGYSSTAMGTLTTASAPGSTATGGGTTASGDYSTAMGFGTRATAFASVSTGRYNLGGGSAPSWVSTDPLFEIGNGTTSITRSNAVTVLKNGNVGIGTHTPQELLHISGGRLRIGSETIEDGGSDILAFSSSLVPTLDGVDRLGGPNRRWLDVYATNGAIQTSDRRKKENIKNLKYGLAEVLQMNPISFNWKNKKNPDTKLGLIAQDILKIIPEVVKTHVWEKDEVSGILTKKELDRLGVYYSDLIPVLIKAIQEQQEIIGDQNVKIEGLTSELTELKSMSIRIKALEQQLKTATQ